MTIFRILVADHHPIFRFGLCSLLGAHDDWQVCGEASDGRDAIQKSRQLKPDLVILDICMPRLNGVDAARQILRENPEQQILVLTDVDSEDVVRDCLEMGVRGWVFKCDRLDDLTIAVESMRQHKASFSMRVADLIMEGYLERQRAGPDVPKVPKLSPREREVVQLVGEGKTSKEVAMILNVTVKTAETHRSNIMYKLKIHSIAELVLYAVRNEIVHVKLPGVLRFPTPPVARTLPLRACN
jgi:DNA-binding NarL/FixJ family response regulator